MRRKLSQVVLLPAALAAAFVFAFATSSSACIYSQSDGIPNTGISDGNPSTLDTTIDQVDTRSNSVEQPSGFNHSGAAAMGLVAIVGLAAGGFLWQARSRQKNSGLAADQTVESSEKSDFEPSTFAIVVPPEVLSSLHNAEESVESDLTLV